MNLTQLDKVLRGQDETFWGRTTYYFVWAAGIALISVTVFVLLSRVAR